MVHALLSAICQSACTSTGACAGAMWLDMRMQPRMLMDLSVYQLTLAARAHLQA